MLGEGIRLESRNLLFGPPLVAVVKIWKCFLEMRPIFVRKLLNNTNIGIG